jgi:hypothetical protein
MFKPTVITWIILITLPASAGSFEEFEPAAPRVGQPAPEIALSTADGRAVRLSELTARGPVVVAFGSFS